MAVEYHAQLHFIQDKLKIRLIITSSHLALKTVWILISWLLQKTADLDLHCFQEKPAGQDPYCLQELIWFHTVFERIDYIV